VSFVLVLIVLARTLHLIWLPRLGAFSCKVARTHIIKATICLLGQPGCLLAKDVLTGIPTELFLDVVHLTWSIFSLTGERVLALMTMLALVVLLVYLLPRGMNSVHVISHPLKSTSQVSCLRVLHFTWGSLSSIGSHDSGIREAE
jgi:hypothetical protein